MMDTFTNVPKRFILYEAPKAGNAEADLVWDSARPGIDDDDMLLDPSEYRALQWVFTKPGTYVLSVQFQGFVRKIKPDGAGQDWKPISPKDAELSEVKKYTIHVGPLSLNEQPKFQVERSVRENSAGGVKVGAPVPVAGGDDGDTLTYKLSGKGSSRFSVAGAPGEGAQVTVAAGASLDYETKPAYDLVLSVSDGKGRTNYPDSSSDNAIALKVVLEDAPVRLDLAADYLSVKINHQVNLTATYQDLPVNADLSTLRFTWKQLDLETSNYYPDVDPTSVGTNYFVHPDKGPRRFYVLLDYNLTDGSPGQQLRSNDVDVTWGH